MELRDLMILDIESLTTTQALQVARDAIAVLTKGKNKDSHNFCRWRPNRNI